MEIPEWSHNQIDRVAVVNYYCCLVTMNQEHRCADSTATIVAELVKYGSDVLAILVHVQL